MANEKALEGNLTGKELQKFFLSLLGKNFFNIWDEEETLKNIGRLSLDQKGQKKMEKGLEQFGYFLSEIDKTIIFKIDKTAFFFFPFCSTQAKGAVMVSEILELEVEP